MIRRSHKKSRTGCAECKRSHKRCDESRPACLNCTIARRDCSYLREAGQGVDGRDFLIFTGPESSAGSRSPQPSINSLTATPSPRPPSPTLSHVEPYVNLLHLELFQNLTSGGISFISTDAVNDDWVSTILQYFFSYPYLMYEALALSAFNLSIRYPSKAHIYRPESTTLQAHALIHFNSSIPVVTEDNILPVFLYSSVLGLHFFCDTFLAPSPDLNTFLDRLVQSIQLLRGVNAVAGESWEYIRNSEIKCLLDIVEEPGPDRDDEVTHGLAALRERISESHTLSAFESKVYDRAIERLVEVYNTQGPDISLNSAPNARLITSWPITLSAEYTELLNQRKPEALIVIAYFSILLHDRREFWAVSDAGRYLLAAIVEFLGDGWSDWLVVPRKLVPC